MVNKQSPWTCVYVYNSIGIGPTVKAVKIPKYETVLFER